LSKTGYLSHNFGSRYAKKSIKCSKDSDDNLDSKKTLSQKIGSLGWRPGQGKVHQKAKNTHTCDDSTDNPKPKTKILFSVSTRRLAESAEGLNSSLAQSAGELKSYNYW